MLLEPGVKYFIGEMLKNCHRFKEERRYVIINILLGVGFFLLLGLWLWVKYRGKLTPEEMEEKEAQKKNYILSKIKNYQDAKIRTQQQLITGLPFYTEADVL